jgi:hypothetical protein
MNNEANQWFLVLVGCEDFCLYHGKYRKFSPGKFGERKKNSHIGGGW